MNDRRTVVEALVDAAERFPERGFTLAGEEGETFVSFVDLAHRAARTGAALRRRGLRRGDRVALALPDTIEFISCFLGCMHAGLVPVPMYPPLRAGQIGHYLDHSRHILRRSGASLMVTAPAIKTILGSLVDATLRSIVTVPRLEIDDRTIAPERVGPDDVAFLQFTSGSTARPKGVTLTYGNLSANVNCIRDGLRLSSDDVGCNWLPLFHDMGLIGFVITPIYMGAATVFLPQIAFLKHPVEWLRRMTRHRATVAFSPNFGYGLCTTRVREKDLASLDLSAWRVAGCGAEPIQRTTLDAFAERFAPAGFRRSALVLAYGLAENTLAVSFSPIAEEPRYEEIDFHLLSAERVAASPGEGAATITVANCGRPFAGHEIAILDPEGEALPERCAGEIALRGPSVMKEYWMDSSATGAITRDGWMLTGDQGFLLDGELHVCGRNKELIIMAGRNYHPADIELVASEVPGIRIGRLVAFGVTSVNADGSTAERVVICAESKARGAPRERIAAAVKVRVLDALGLKVSDVLLLERASLPRTSSGKLQRTRAREWYLSGRLDTAGEDEGKLAQVRHLVASQWGFLRGRVSSLIARRTVAVELKEES
ncbi:MAG TPA: fatty acyl-AMP ligase [Thermoanaerobaculia bacterium]|nr:fatty acyl-AMP ligase [Thermoanaerobaculia bacterium]